MDIKSNILIMSTMPYNIKDEATGSTNSGISVEYFFFGEDGIKPEKYNTDGLAGIKRAKASLPITAAPYICELPGIFCGLFEMVNDKDGKTRLALRNIERIGGVEFVVVPDEEKPLFVGGNALDDNSKADNKKK